MNKKLHDIESNINNDIEQNMNNIESNIYDINKMLNRIEVEQNEKVNELNNKKYSIVDHRKIPTNRNETNNNETNKNYKAALEKLNNKIIQYKKMYTDKYNYDRKLFFITFFPIVVMSAFTGTANLISNYIPEKYQNNFILVIGCINIFSAFITAIVDRLNSSKISGEQKYLLHEFDQLNSKADFLIGRTYISNYVIENSVVESIENKLQEILSFAPEIPNSIQIKYN